MDLTTLGWNPHFDQHFAPFRSQGLIPGRVAREDRFVYLVLGAAGEWLAEVSGHFRHAAFARSAFPAIGDWVAFQPYPTGERATIQAVLPRQSRFARKVAGFETEEQVLAANVDTVFLMSSLDQELNLRRLERYLTLAWDSNANPVIVLNKADLCPRVEEQIAAVQAIAFGVPIHALSAQMVWGIEALQPYLLPGQTIALLGSSGVGKSTLVNTLLGEERQKTGAVRADDSRGRHITVRRELIPLPGGALLIDNPGLRSVHLWGDGESLGETFEDIAALAQRCRFRDCQHRHEPGCAVRQALAQGMLPPERFESYLKLQKELQFLARRTDVRARLEQKEQSKRRAKFGRQLEHAGGKHR